MTKKDLRALLDVWARAVTQSEDLRSDVTAGKWPVEMPATKEAIAAAESRLGRKLPRDYRTFLEVSNGWRYFDKGRRLLGVEELELLGRANPELVDACVRPLVDAGLDGLHDDGMLPAAHYQTLVRISADDDGFYVLDPNDRTRFGWAARFFASWVPGAAAAKSFEELLRERLYAFLEERGISAELGVPARKFNLKVPPKVWRTNPIEFLDELERLEFFDRTPAQRVLEMRAAFLTLHARANGDELPGIRMELAPMRELLKEETKRIVWLDVDELTDEGVTAAVGRVGPLLAARGVELPEVEEEKDEESWAARLGGLRATVCRMRRGRPLGLGMDDPSNVAQAVINAACVVLNGALRELGTECRVASVADQTFTPDGEVLFRHGLLVVTDELSYELMWNNLGGKCCSVVRGDVF